MSRRKSTNYAPLIKLLFKTKFGQLLLASCMLYWMFNAIFG